MVPCGLRAGCCTPMQGRLCLTVPPLLHSSQSTEHVQQPPLYPGPGGRWVGGAASEGSKLVVPQKESYAEQTRPALRTCIDGQQTIQAASSNSQAHMPASILQTARRGACCCSTLMPWMWCQPRTASGEHIQNMHQRVPQQEHPHVLAGAGRCAACCHWLASRTACCDLLLRQYQDSVCSAAAAGASLEACWTCSCSWGPPRWMVGLAAISAASAADGAACRSMACLGGLLGCSMAW